MADYIICFFDERKIDRCLSIDLHVPGVYYLYCSFCVGETKKIK
jgi:hypothetical protein